MTLQDFIAQAPDVDSIVGRLGLQKRPTGLASAAINLPAAFAVGALAGIAAALLAAPGPGAELRAKLKCGLQDSYDRLRDRLGNATPAKKRATPRPPLAPADGVS